MSMGTNEQNRLLKTIQRIQKRMPQMITKRKSSLSSVILVKKERKSQNGMTCMLIFLYGKFFVKCPKSSGFVFIVIARWFLWEQPSP